MSVLWCFDRRIQDVLSFFRGESTLTVERFLASSGKGTDVFVEEKWHGVVRLPIPILGDKNPEFVFFLLIGGLTNPKDQVSDGSDFKTLGKIFQVHDFLFQGISPHLPA